MKQKINIFKETKMNTKRFIIVLVLCSLVLVLLTQGLGCKKTTSTASGAVQKWTCPMHPEVISDKPGQCPKCGMDLVKIPAKAEPNLPSGAAAK
jgi:hypothetical protein